MTFNSFRSVLQSINTHIWVLVFSGREQNQIVFLKTQGYIVCCFKPLRTAESEIHIVYRTFPMREIIVYWYLWFHNWIPCVVHLYLFRSVSQSTNSLSLQWPYSYLHTIEYLPLASLHNFHFFCWIKCVVLCTMAVVDSWAPIESVTATNMTKTLSKVQLLVG
jgi:hypothetical protein